MEVNKSNLNILFNNLLNKTNLEFSINEFKYGNIISKLFVC